ncbi:MAG TPA: hypothetical protein VIU11_12645 [Nakamurella sp.]
MGVPPSLLLLHGLTEAGTAWPDAVRRWENDYRIVAAELRGHGRSPRFDLEQLRSSSEVWLTDVLGVRRDDPDAFHAVVDPFLVAVTAGPMSR